MMTLEKENISLFITKVFFALFVTGCLYTNNNSDHLDNIESDLLEVQSRELYSQNLISQITSAVKNGDITLARTYLMTNSFREEYKKKYPKTYNGRFGKSQAKIFFFRLAAEVLPQIGTDEVLVLLDDYYGKEREYSPVLRRKDADLMVRQLIVGPHIKKKNESVVGKIEIHEIFWDSEKEKEKGDVNVRVFYTDNQDTFIWIFQFRRFELNGKNIWVPINWNTGGYV